MARTIRPTSVNRFLPSLVLVFSLASYTLLRSNLTRYSEACSIASKSNTTDTIESSLFVPEDDETDRPKVVWLASYPNSGTSYTMTMVQRATNLATATQYGAEVTIENEDPSPVFPDSPDGPFWDASGNIGTKRSLPSHYIMTKTHCGGRCVKCPANEYVTDAATFLKACEKTSGFRRQKRFESSSSVQDVAKVIHLIRNPFDNIIARFHLEQKHIIAKNPGLESFLPRNATGFRRWCADLDKTYSYEDKHYFNSQQQSLMRIIPCHAEFFKYAQWHNLLMEATLHLPTLIIFYEDYHTAQNSTSQQIFDFLQQERSDELRPFRSPPMYSDHFRASERTSAKEFLETVSSATTWSLLRPRYFDSEI